jgi:hypothetical protein
MNSRLNRIRDLMNWPADSEILMDGKWVRRDEAVKILLDEVIELFSE